MHYGGGNLLPLVVGGILKEAGRLPVSVRGSSFKGKLL